jgi:copper chaperone NosL
MTVVSKQHAAQAVTYKGKIFMFDAIECLLHYQIDNPSQSFTHLLINDFSQAGKLIEAQSSTYLISQAMPSPMGAFLNGFEDKNVALEFQKKKGGEVYNWNSLLKKVKMDKGSMDMDLNE